jgi:hypothetical protein
MERSEACPVCGKVTGIVLYRYDLMTTCVKMIYTLLYYATGNLNLFSKLKQTLKVCTTVKNIVLSTCQL